MHIREDLIEDICILTPEDRIDSTTCSVLEGALNERVDAGQTTLVVDFNEVSFVSSAGLRVLLLIARKLNPQKGKLLICGLNETVHEVFEVSGFVRLFSIFSDVHEAIKSTKAE